MRTHQPAPTTAPSAILPENASPGSSIELIVLHTTTSETLRALRTAADLAQGLGARIRLMVLQVVPYPLSLGVPDVPLKFTHQRFRTIAAACKIDTYVDIRLGRDYSEMLGTAIQPGSVIVMGGSRRWWPAAEARLAKRLERQGHHVIFAKAS